MKAKNLIIYATATSLALATTGIKLCLDSKKLEKRIEQKLEEKKDDDILVTAHRGFSSLEVENTSEAIKLAAEKDYINTIEIDARMTKDGKLVLSHDNMITKRNGKAIISNMTYKDISDTTFFYDIMTLDKASFSPESYLIFQRKLALLGQKYHIISLKDGINLRGNKQLLIDLKFHNDIIPFTEELKKELETVDTTNVIIQSLDLEGINYLRKNSNFSCMALISKITDLKKVEDFERIGLKYTIINYPLIDRLIKEGKEIFIWTINDCEILDKITTQLKDHAIEVNYITDNPDIIAAKLLSK